MQAFTIAVVVVISAFGITHSSLMSPTPWIADFGYGDVDPFSCDYFAASFLFNGICGSISNLTQQIQAQYCDAHCRCVHGTDFGQCKPFAPGTEPVVTYGDEMCACFNEADGSVRPEYPPQTSCNDPINELPNAAVLNLLCRTQWDETYGACSADCICAHNMQYGYCLGETSQCICTNDKNDIPITYWTQERNGSYVNWVVAMTNATTGISI